jgi:release factor glutamine methyltransferase
VALSYREALERAASLASDSSRLDAELLLCHATGASRSQLYGWPERLLTPEAEAQYNALINQRQQGMPVAYLLGQREFWSLPLAVNASTLIPRPDTEVLVEAALTLWPSVKHTLPLCPEFALADLGTGTGAIALALAKELPHLAILAVDANRSACDLASANSQALGLPLVVEHGNWLDLNWCQRFVARGPYALIVSNPPYLAQDDPHLQQGDVRFEPSSALVAGEDGLSDYRVLIPLAKAALAPGGALLLEHGADQASALQALLAAEGFSDIHTDPDYALRDRVTHARRTH